MSLFLEYTDRNVSLTNAGNIPNLGLVYDFITVEQENALLTIIESNVWISDLKRRVQHYGYKYDYRARTIDNSNYLGPLPAWVLDLAQKFIRLQIMHELADQAIINEYVQDQGIAPHIDCEPCFGNTIVSLSLGGSCVMDFQNIHNKVKIPILLEPRSIIILRDESRYLWTHGIAPRKRDHFNGSLHQRSRRLSVTFRKVNA
jgi:alkylated DNA repair dioxygenase AlkB